MHTISVGWGPFAITAVDGRLTPSSVLVIIVLAVVFGAMRAAWDCDEDRNGGEERGDEPA